MEKNAELLFLLESLGLLEHLSIHDNPEEVRQLMNKIGRPELFQECIEEIKSKEEDNDYSTETSEQESETDEDDIVEEEYIINPSMNGFYEIKDVHLKR